MIKHPDLTSQHEKEAPGLFSFFSSPGVSSFPRLPERVGEGGESEDRGGGPLPCLYSNNSIGTPIQPLSGKELECVQALTGVLSPYHKKVAHTLFANVSRLISLAKSPSHVGFLTLTFPDNVVDHKEAYKRFRSFNSNYLAKHPKFGEWVCVKERQARGAWHYHLVIQTQDDIKTGLDFAELEQGIYKSANEDLRDLWRDLRENLPKYQMGRSELLPVKSNKEAMARYIGKYVSKHIGQRDDQDKGVRLVNYSRGWSKNSVNFAWFTDNSKLWRKKLKMFAEFMGCTEMYQLQEKLGPGWAYKYADDIFNIPFIIAESGGNKAPDYENNTVQRIQENRKKREKIMMDNLTIHHRSKPKGDTKKKIEFKNRLPHMIEDYRQKYIVLDDLLEEAFQEKASPPPDPDGSKSLIPF